MESRTDTKTEAIHWGGECIEDMPPLHSERPHVDRQHLELEKLK